MRDNERNVQILEETQQCSTLDTAGEAHILQYSKDYDKTANTDGSTRGGSKCSVAVPLAGETSGFSDDCPDYIDKIVVV